MPASQAIRIGIVVLLAISWLLNSCQHDSLIMDEDIDIPPVDTIMPPDTMMNPMDTIIPCDSTVIYFSTQVLPILKANCAQSGCHDAISAVDGINLEDYNSTINSNIIVPFDIVESEIMERILESDVNKRMPPAPANALSIDQINLIAEWILQGAKDEMCDDPSADCQVSNVKYSANILPIINVHCRSCHSGGSPSGGVDLSTHGTVQQAALNGSLLGSISHLSGYTPMPFNQPMLDSCVVLQFEAWINEGALDN